MSDKVARLSAAYRAVKLFYSGARAARSGVLKMRHIDEGVAILEDIGASSLVQQAFCLHPIFQHDCELSGASRYLSAFPDIDPWVIVLVMEYRAVANDYLSTRRIASLNEVRLGPLFEVRQMLIADKVQNRKDFEYYHKDTHPRSKQLDKYFKNWMQILCISEFEYLRFCGLILRLDTQATPEGE